MSLFHSLNHTAIAVKNNLNPVKNIPLVLSTYKIGANTNITNVSFLLLHRIAINNNNNNNNNNNGNNNLNNTSSLVAGKIEDMSFSIGNNNNFPITNELFHLHQNLMILRLSEIHYGVYKL